MLATLLGLALTCHVVYSPGDDGDWALRYLHEVAHCNGWTHGPEGPREPPPEYIHQYQGRLIDTFLETPDAKIRCLGLEACQWFCRPGVSACPDVRLNMNGAN